MLARFFALFAFALPVTSQQIARAPQVELLAIDGGSTTFMTTPTCSEQFGWDAGSGGRVSLCGAFGGASNFIRTQGGRIFGRTSAQIDAVATASQGQESFVAGSSAVALIRIQEGAGVAVRLGTDVNENVGPFFYASQGLLEIRNAQTGATLSIDRLTPAFGGLRFAYLEPGLYQFTLVTNEAFARFSAPGQPGLALTAQREDSFMVFPAQQPARF